MTILGSTGSIGTQAIDIVRRNPERFLVHALTAGGSDLDLLAAQAVELRAQVVGVARGSVDELRSAVASAAARRLSSPTMSTPSPGTCLSSRTIGRPELIASLRCERSRLAPSAGQTMRPSTRRSTRVVSASRSRSASSSVFVRTTPYPRERAVSVMPRRAR